MSKSDVVTAHVDEATAELVDCVAARHDQGRSWFVGRVLTEAAKRKAEFLAFIQEGIDELDRGEGIPHAKRHGRAGRHNRQAHNRQA